MLCHALQPFCFANIIRDQNDMGAFDLELIHNFLLKFFRMLIRINDSNIYQTFSFGES